MGTGHYLDSRMNVTPNDKAIPTEGSSVIMEELSLLGLYQLFPVVLFQLCGGLLFGSDGVLNKREILIHFAC